MCVGGVCVCVCVFVLFYFVFCPDFILYFKRDKNIFGQISLRILQSLYIHVSTECFFTLVINFLFFA